MGLDMYLSTTTKPERMVFYWRKANQIREWIANRANEDREQQIEYHLSKNELTSLLEDIQKVMSKPELAPEVLPTASGFFFGSTEYDQYYFVELARTLEELKPIVDDLQEDETMLYGEWW